MTAELTRQVKALARQLGFDFVGVTTPEPPPHYPKFLDWLQAGRHGEMAYLARPRAQERRADPRRILPECRSVLVLGVHHQPPETAPQQASGLRGRVAAYAWGDDYHDVLVERLQALHAGIERLAGRPVAARWYTDTGPLLERDLAQRAGLGWIGKNTCLINPQAGSYFLLAELLLDLPLEVDRPIETDHCGSCTRCLEACPTACILPDRTLDARRCLSYLTIELKGPIPPELRPQMGDWVFGCDVCQQVCPWNQRFAPGAGDPAFAPRPQVPAPDLVQELALTPEDFNRKFKGSPVKRAKRRGYLRNVAVALGNARDERALPALARALQNDPEPLVRAHAAWALGRYPGQAARAALQGALAGEPELEVRQAVREALAGMENGVD